MSLDWEQFKEIVEYKNEDTDRHSQLMNIVRGQGVLIEFLTQLLKELKEVEKSSEIVDRYPHIGQLLTKAATHPYLGCVLPAAQLLITCLIEYSKLNLDASDDHSVDLCIHSKKSIDWCIVRLRRFISVAKNGSRREQVSQAMTQKISELLDRKADQLDSQQIMKVADKCLLLAHAEDSRLIIEKLVAYALPESTSDIHFDRLRPSLSDKFIYELANDNQQHTSLRTQYFSWPNELRQKLFIYYDELLEFEVLALIETYITTLSTQTKYISIEVLEVQIMQNKFVKTLQNSPTLTQTTLQCLSNYVIQYKNWNLVRLAQCLNRCLSSQLNDYCLLVVKDSNINNTKAKELYDIVIGYIFGGGSVEDIYRRRNEAWCLSLSYHRFTWYCVYQIVQWCKTEGPWSQQMEHNLVYLNWMIHPSLDNRESESLSFLRYWIQTCRGNNRLCDELPKRWHNILNRNGVLVGCFVTSIFFSNNQLHVDHQISLIRSIFIREKDFHGSTENKNGFDIAMVYMFLDHLNEMELHAELYPTTTFDVGTIKDYIFKHFISNG